MIHNYLGQTVSFEIVYKKRTSMGITIDIYGNVEVLVPKGTSDERVLQFIEEKWDWVQLKSKEMKDRLLGKKIKVYDHGEFFLYLGNEYPIQVSHDITIQQDYVVFEGDK